MNVKLRRIGNSRILTIPQGINIVSTEYTVKNDGMKIVFTPVMKKKNVFATKDWKNYDYQKDIDEDPELQSVESV